MGRARHLWLLVILCWCCGPSAEARSFPWDDYGPACQWLRLSGRLERPTALPAGEPWLLTVTYRLPEQKVPATLLTNVPIAKDHFFFVLSGFDQRIQGVVFVPPMFFFSERIEFQYFATSADRRWRSDLRTSVYRPERIKKDGQILCQTALDLGALTLKEH